MGVYVGNISPALFHGMNCKTGDQGKILEIRIDDQQEVTNVDWKFE